MYFLNKDEFREYLLSESTGANEKILQDIVQAFIEGLLSMATDEIPDIDVTDIETNL